MHFSPTLGHTLSMKNTDNKTTKDLGPRPHQNEYLAKKRREREKTFFTRKNTYRLIFMSLLLCGAFVLWAERTGFEGEDIFITILGFFMMFATVIVLSLVGAIGLMAFRKWRTKSKSSFLDHDISQDKPVDD